MDKVTAVITYNEIDDYAEVRIETAAPRRFPSVIYAATFAGLAGATEVEAREVGAEQLTEIVFWFREARARREKQEAQAAEWSQRAFHGKGARQMIRDRFGKFRGLAIEY
jgi:hypothetical protein